MNDAKERFEAVEPETGQKRLREIARLSPALYRAYVKGLYGDLEGRNKLSEEDKGIVAVAASLALGLSTPALRIQIEGAFNRSLSLEKLELIVTQSVTYVGFHRAIDFLWLVQDVADQRGMTVTSRSPIPTELDDHERYRRGTEAYEALISNGEEMIRAPFSAMAPDLAETTFQIFGDVYAREGISLRQRQIGTVATLASLDNGGPQLRLHIGTALHVGVTKEEIVEVMMLIQAHAGMPAAYNGMLAAREVFAQTEQQADTYD